MIDLSYGTQDITEIESLTRHSRKQTKMQNNPIKNETRAVRHYAVRRVNPFRGVMQIIEAEQGRALSCNGIVWEILVRARQGSSPDSIDGSNSKKSYYRFGMWSMDHGLMKRSNSPVADQDYFELVSKCEALVEYVRQHHHQLPFELEDNLELWLFDNDNQRPLALLASLSPGAIPASAEPKQWLASTGANGSASQRRFPQARELEMQVSKRAGLNINKYWIKRLPGGDGVLENTGRSISADQFPILLMDESWKNAEEQYRVREYIKWIAPSLLTLQHLDKDTRERLENNLHVQAISIEHHRHLYPEIIDQKLLKAARVQNQIEQCS